MVGDDDALYQCAQFDIREPLGTRRFADETHPFVDARSPPAGKIGRRRATMPECDTRKTNDVGLARCKREEAPTVAANQNWRVWLLNRQRPNLVIGNTIMPTREVDLFSLEKPFDDGDRLGQTFDPDTASVETETSLLVFGLNTAG